MKEEPVTGNPLVFVTGGTGLIGAHLLSDLAARGFRVRALKRKKSDLSAVQKIFGYYHPDPDQALAQIEWVDGDLDSTAFLQEALQGIGQVYHCAAMVSFDPKDRIRMMETNVGGTEKIVGQCLRSGVRKFCFVSSSASLGKPADGMAASIDELTPWTFSGDLSDYAVSKYQAEQKVWLAAREGLRSVIINPVIVIGPGDWSRSSSKIIRTVWKGFPFYTSGVNAFVDVRDVTKSAILLMESPIHGERFVVAAENLPYKHLFDQIADRLNKRKPFIPLSGFMSGVAWRADWAVSKLTGKPPQLTRAAAISAQKRYYFSNKKIRNALGIEFIPIHQSINDTCRLFLAEHQIP